jgi:hypothetical protein
MYMYMYLYVVSFKPDPLYAPVEEQSGHFDTQDKLMVYM